MYLLIAIIFIAELIIAGFITLLICKSDNSVKSLNEKVLSARPAVTASMKAARKNIVSVRTGISSIRGFFARKHVEFWRKVVNLIAIYLIIRILRVRFKKAANLLQYSVFLKDCWDSIPLR